MKFDEIDIHKFGDTIQIVGAVAAGEGRAFALLFPTEAARLLETPEILEMTPANWEQFFHQTDRLEVRVRTPDGSGELQHIVVAKSQRHINSEVSWAVWRRDNYRCRYCGRDKVPLTVDHLVLWEEGGPWTMANLVAADKICNRTRGNMPFGEWLDSPDYKRLAKGLDDRIRSLNAALLPTLDKIPRVQHIRSR